MQSICNRTPYSASAKLRCARHAQGAVHRHAATAPSRHRQRRLQLAAAAAGAPAEPEPQPAGAGQPEASSSGQAEAASSSSDWSRRAVSLPMGVPTAGAVFVAAGVLKLVIMCFPWSEMSIMMFMHGRADLGVMAALKAVPIALALAAGAKAIVDRGLQKRRWVQAAVVTCGALMLVLSRWAFARPKPSPLDPMFKRMQQERMAAIAEQRRMQAQEQQRRQHMLRQPDAARGRELMQQQEQAAAAAAAATKQS